MTQPPQAKKSTLNNHIIMRTQKQTVAGPGPGLILVAGLIGVPLLEIALFIEVGGRLGLGPTLALIVLSVHGLRRQRHDRAGRAAAQV